MTVNQVKILVTIAVLFLLVGQLANVKVEAETNLDVSEIGIKEGTVINLVHESNGLNSTSTTTTTVIADPSPNKPVVNPISNKDLFISGTAELNSTVYVLANGKTYTQTLVNTNQFNLNFENNKPLKEGTVITVYVMDEALRKSEVVTIKVSDKIPPTVPVVNKVTDKSFVISGKSEPGTTVYIRRNSIQLAVIKANLSGVFSLPIPLQTKGTVFEIYSVDSSNNQSSRAKTSVLLQSRLARNILNVPIVRQMPELPRGCEVTSLTMLLNYTGIKVNKMTLAKQVKKDPTTYKVVNGKKYFGNPNYGFVGDMYTFKKPGFGVYNKPIAALANQYKPNRIVNLSGQSFESVLNYVSTGHPVWIINTSWFSIVPNSYWQTWNTPQGPVRITMKEHSVVVTGYDSKYVYFNDPLDGQKNKKKPMKQFIDGWKQYGSQAISYY